MSRGRSHNNRGKRAVSFIDAITLTRTSCTTEQNVSATADSEYAIHSMFRTNVHCSTIGVQNAASAASTLRVGALTTLASLPMYHFFTRLCYIETFSILLYRLSYKEHRWKSSSKGKCKYLTRCRAAQLFIASM